MNSIACIPLEITLHKRNASQSLPHLVQLGPEKLGEQPESLERKQEIKGTY